MSLRSWPQRNVPKVSNCLEKTVPLTTKRTLEPEVKKKVENEKKTEKIRKLIKKI